MSTICRIAAALLGLLIASHGTTGAAADPVRRETVLGTVIDFAGTQPGPYQKGFLDSWRWSEEFRGQARSGSKLEIVADAATGRSALRVRVDDAAILERGPLILLRLAPFYPPEADGLRLRVKVLRGRVRIFAGGPTAYYANSDVFTRTGELDAAAEPHSVTLDLSLQHPLRRNFRRAGLSTEATRNYYNRWAQEPLAIYLEAGTAGEFILERIELIATGEGRPFPTFADGDVQVKSSLADFDQADRRSAFNLYMADAETEWFEQSWLRERPLRFTPATISYVDDAERRSKVLVASGPSAEEVHCTGLHVDGVAGANAVQLFLRHDAPDYRNTVVGWGRAEAVDLFLFVGAGKSSREWDVFAAPAELRAGRVGGFDYQLSYRAIRNRSDVNLAIYQARRYVRPQEWTKLVVPLADFVCIYGAGTFRERFLRREPVRSDEVNALAWLNPWCRTGGGPVELRIDDPAFVQVPGEPAELRSFWQLPDGINLEWRKFPNRPAGGEQIMLLPGDEW